MMAKLTATSIGILVFALLPFDLYTVLVMAQNDDYDPETWIAPGELQKQFPYYLSGLDKKGQPVFVMEFGKWDVRTYLEGGRDVNVLNHFRDQMLYRFGKAENLLKSENSTGLFGILVDYDGFQGRQLTHGPTLYFFLTTIRNALPIIRNKMDYDIVVNLQGPGETLANLIAPLFGSLFSKVELYGTNKDAWIPMLLKRISKESLAPKYGGSAEEPFKPLAVYD